jgi:phage tail sheath protein FI
MGFLVSPGVEIKEIDLSDIIPAQSTSIGGFAGFFRWGPIGELVTVSSEKDLARIFGAPSTENATLERSFLQAAGFLKYSNNLKVSRANASGSFNAISDYDASPAEEFTISSVTELESNQAALNTAGAHIVARYAGALGNTLKVHVVNASNYSAQPSSVKAALQFTPATTDWADALTGGTAVNDEVSIVVVDEDGEVTGAAGEILEVHEGLSIGRNAKNQFGESNYWADFVNTNSSLIFGVKNTATDAEITAATTDLGAISWLSGGTDLSLAGGADATVFASSTVSTALDLFEDSETVDVNLLFAYEDGDDTVDSRLKTIVDTRRDCVGFISAPLTVKDQTSDAAKKSEVTTKFDAIGSSSYLVFDSTPAYVYNKYRDAYAWVSLSGHIAGLCASTDDVADPWFSPAGLNRGQLQGIVRLAYNPKQADRDELYQKRVNPVLTLPGQGTVLFGDKTALTKPSAFDRINVRRLFITIEKAIATASKFQLFELNDTFTRSTFRNAIEPFLRDVQGRRGITDFRVVCDESNNTGEVIDGNRFVADIYIKPTRSINFVTLNFVATRTGTAFEELVGR